MAASREEIYERVKEVLSEQLGVEEGEILIPNWSSTSSS